MANPGENFVRVNYKRYQNWLIPKSAVCSILSFALISMLVGIILLAIGSFLTPWGAVLFVVGVLCLCVCICLCLHAYCIFKLKDEETQTTEEIHIITKDSDLSPTFTVLDKKPPLGPDSGIRNGRYGGGSLSKKQVSISPGVGSDVRTIPIQYQGPQQAQVTYAGQGNRGYTSQSAPGSAGQTGSLSSAQHGYQGGTGNVSGGFGSTHGGTHTTGNYPPYSGSGHSSTGNYQSHGGSGHTSTGNYQSHGGSGQVVGHYSSGGQVSGSYPTPVSGTHLHSGYQHGGQISSGSYQGSKTGTMSSQSSRGHSPGYAYPLQPQQPTPYSTLTQKSATPVTITHVQHSPGLKQTGGFDEDYDNTAETAPMIGHSQNQSTQSWRPSGASHGDEAPEPQPLVYPSERRPMTFDKVSSSKMSIYDNMYSLDKLDE